jgi:hypothetical protein
VLIVQGTTIDHVAGRLAKARARPELAGWLQVRGAFEVHGWTRRGGRWYCKRVTVRPEDLAGVVITAPPRRAGRQPTLPGFE